MYGLFHLQFSPSWLRDLSLKWIYCLGEKRSLRKTFFCCCAQVHRDEYFKNLIEESLWERGGWGNLFLNINRKGISAEFWEYLHWASVSSLSVTGDWFLIVLSCLEVRQTINQLANCFLTLRAEYLPSGDFKMSSNCSLVFKAISLDKSEAYDQSNSCFKLEHCQ